MQDSTWIATVAGLALGISIILAIIMLVNRREENGVAYVYDEQNRLQSIYPMDAKQIRLRGVD